MLYNLALRQNKLGRLSSAFFRGSLMFASKAGAYWSGWSHTLPRLTPKAGFWSCSEIVE
jgi:hypothetical protein